MSPTPRSSSSSYGGGGSRSNDGTYPSRPLMGYTTRVIHGDGTTSWLSGSPGNDDLPLSMNKAVASPAMIHHQQQQQHQQQQEHQQHQQPSLMKVDTKGGIITSPPSAAPHCSSSTASCSRGVSEPSSSAQRCRLQPVVSTANENSSRGAQGHSSLDTSVVRSQKMDGSTRGELERTIMNLRLLTEEESSSSSSHANSAAISNRERPMHTLPNQLEETHYAADTSAMVRRDSNLVNRSNDSASGRRGVDPPEFLVIYNEGGRSQANQGGGPPTQSDNDHGAIEAYQPPQSDNNQGAMETYKKAYKKKISSSGRSGCRELARWGSSSSSTLGQGFDHCFVKAPRKERLSVLFATLRRSSNRKVIVVCSTWESCQFHAILFRQLEIAHVYELHERLHDVKRAHDEFAHRYPGILFASDMQVREFDIPPNVDYLIQYEPPMNPTEYVYRMDTTRLQNTSCRKALLFVTPDEIKFLNYFADQNIDAMELEGRKLSKFRYVVENLVSKHTELNDYAWDAFRSFMVAYKNHSHGDVYVRSNMDEVEVLRSFGQPKDPLNLSDIRVVRDKESNVGMKVDKKKVSESTKYSQSQKPAWMKGDKTWRERNTVNKSRNLKEDTAEVKTSVKKENTEGEDEWKKTVGMEKTWRTGHKTKSWMTKEKSWKHSHVHL